MNRIFRSPLWLVLAVLAPIILALQPATLDAQTQSARTVPRTATHTAEKQKMNAWTIGLDLGRFPYPAHEPMAFWGDAAKLKRCLQAE